MDASKDNTGTSIDTRFRTALRRLNAAGRIEICTQTVDPHLEVAALMKKRDGGKAILFPRVKGFDTPIVGNLLASRENCEAAFDASFLQIREFVGRALSNPLAPQKVQNAPAQEVVHTSDFDIRELFPALHHAPGDGGRFITAGIVLVRDPETGVYNASYHRLQFFGPDRTGIKLDYGRHLRLAHERATRSGKDLPIVVCIGADLALHYTAATMGSQMPEGADELAVAGGLCGQPLPVVDAITQPLIVPAEAEFVIEGRILAEQEAMEGPFGEFVGFAAPAAPSPVFAISAITHRRNPIYHAINGYGRETVMLRKYVLEASLLRAVVPAVPVVADVEMTAGGLHRFHAIIQIRKSAPQHDGLQRNAILAAFGALKDLDLVIAVDDDIDIRDPLDVEYALATRMEAASDLIVIPAARGHEYVRVARNGIRAKLGIDATVSYNDKERFRRVSFAQIPIDEQSFTVDPDAASHALMLEWKPAT